MKKILFNHHWYMAEGTGTIFGPPANLPEKHSVCLPHDSMIHTLRCPDTSDSASGYYTAGVVNYTKSFFLDSYDAQKVVWIEFEGLFQNAFIYVNDVYVYHCTYGYGNYYVNMTKYVNFGAENIIRVVLKNMPKMGRWYTGAGIYRDVYLMIGDRLHIQCEGVRVTPYDIHNDYSLVRLEVPVENSGCVNSSVKVISEIFDMQNSRVALKTSELGIFENESRTCRQELYIENPKLWSIEEPYLYRYRTRLIMDGKFIDEDTGSFGVRRLQLDAYHGLRINGRQICLRGGCIHSDYGIIGTACFEHAEERRIKKLKLSGYNAIRSAHHPIGRKTLEVCDRLGMLVVDEFTDVWNSSKADFDYSMHFEQHWQQDMINWVRKDYNHPCVIIYSLGNEIEQIGSWRGADIGLKMAELLRSLDSTRYITNGINFLAAAKPLMKTLLKENHVQKKDDIQEINNAMTQLEDVLQWINTNPKVDEMTAAAIDYLDIAGYNYASERYYKDIVRFPERIIVGTETSPAALAKNWEMIKKYPNIIGDFCWTAWDYLGEAGIGRMRYRQKENIYGNWPWRVAYCGMFNLIGDERPLSYWRQIVWGIRKKPYIGVCPPGYTREEKYISQWCQTDAVCSWNWPGFEGQEIYVEVYSNAAEVELFINGQSCGRKKVDNCSGTIPYWTEFLTVYEPGIIEARAYDMKGNTEIFSVTTAKDDNTLKIETDRECIYAGGQDIAYITLSLCDSQGILDTSSEKRLHIHVEGCGELLGFGSANPCCTDNYYEMETSAFEGRALAVVRSTEQKGRIKISVEARGCLPQTIFINSI